MIFKLELLRRSLTGKWEHVTYAWINADKDHLDEVLTIFNQASNKDYFWDIAND